MPYTPPANAVSSAFADVISVPAGTVSAPAIAPTGDSNTGLFFPAADTVAISTGGAERVRVNNTGIVDYYNKSNILGTVSQSDGVPTGAVIERGSNANGSFVKYADGTMIMSRYDAFYSVAAAPYNATWTFPAVSTALCTVFGVKAALRGYRDGSTVTCMDSKFSDAILQFSANDTSYTVTAFGRWY